MIGTDYIETEMWDYDMVVTLAECFSSMVSRCMRNGTGCEFYERRTS